MNIRTFIFLKDLEEYQYLIDELMLNISMENKLSYFLSFNYHYGLLPVDEKVKYKEHLEFVNNYIPEFIIDAKRFAKNLLDVAEVSEFDFIHPGEIDNIYMAYLYYDFNKSLKDLNKLRNYYYKRNDNKKEKLFIDTAANKFIEQYGKEKRVVFNTTQIQELLAKYDKKTSNNFDGDSINLIYAREIYSEIKSNDDLYSNVKTIAKYFLDLQMKYGNKSKSNLSRPKLVDAVLPIIQEKYNALLDVTTKKLLNAMNREGYKY